MMLWMASGDDALRPRELRGRLQWAWNGTATAMRSSRAAGRSFTETFVADGRCETAAALLARPPLSFRTTRQAPEPIWKAPAPRQYNSYFEAAIGTLKAERRYRVFADLARDAEPFPKADWLRRERRRRRRHHLVLERLSRHGPASARDRGDARHRGKSRRRRRRHPQHFRHQPRHCRPRGRARRPARQAGALVFTSG